MSTEANKAFARRLFEEVFNKQNLALAGELLAPGAVSHAAPAGTADGPEGIRQVVTMLSNAFPDQHTTIEDLIAEGDKVVVSATFSGTHQGAFMGIPPTGKHFTQRQIHILCITDGKLAEHWAVMDDLAMMRQLGMAPTPGR